MRTWWQEKIHPVVHHWYEENGAVYAVMLSGSVEHCISSSVWNMNDLCEREVLVMKELPEKQAKRLPNNFTRRTV